MAKTKYQHFFWSFYLACSWMWCIGMFYPVLLYRDFGIFSWFVFAVPNVIGATIVPWFIKSSQHSENFVKEHGVACRFFSIATILFQIYFLAWTIISFKLTNSVIFLIFFIFLVAFYVSKIRLLLVSFVIFLASLAGLLFVSYNPEKILTVQPTGYGFIELLGLIPVFCIGFLFCPYLDLTFHRVIRVLKQSEIKQVYLVGFPVLFLFLLVLGVNYYPVVYHILLGSVEQSNIVIGLVCFYIVSQTCFTSIVHIIELKKEILSSSYWVLLMVLSVGVGLYAIFAKQEVVLFGGSMQMREILYRCFLSIYGLLAPVYVWIFVILKTLLPQQYISNSTKLYAWFWAVLIALPFYIMGFFGTSKTVFHVLPVGVLLALVIPLIVFRLNYKID